MNSSPLSIRLQEVGSGHDQHVTDNCQSWSFTKAAPGGHMNAQVRLNIDRNRWPGLGDNDRLWFYDKLSSRAMFDGYTSFPGTSDGVGGQGFDLSAKGGADRLKDDRRASVFIDYSQDTLVRYDQQTPSATIQLGAADANSPTYGPAFRGQFVPGAPITTGSQVGIDYTKLNKNGQRLYSVSATLVCGKTDGNYTQEIFTRTGAGAFTSAAARTFSLVAAGMTPIVVTNFALGSDIARVLVWRSTGGQTTVTTDDTWGGYYGLHFRPILLNADGTDDLTVASVNYVLVSEVVNDMVGRMMPWVDAAASSIATTTAQIDQLVYDQAVSVEEILGDLAAWEGDYLHEVLETTGNGKHIFNYRAWPASARYEISLKDGYNRPGSDQGLCNRINVSWNDAAGIPQTTLATLAVPDLDAISRIRHASGITLPEGTGSLANAQTTGAQALAEVNRSVNSASARIVRKIFDIAQGRMVSPWEIEPGYLVRVRETSDLLRLTQMTCSWSQEGGAETQLQLGRPVLSIVQRIEQASKGAGPFSAGTIRT